ESQGGDPLDEALLAAVGEAHGNRQQDGLPERPQRRNFHRAPLGGLVCRRSQPTSSVQEVCLSIHADARQWRATLSDFRFHEKLLLNGKATNNGLSAKRLLRTCLVRC